MPIDYEQVRINSQKSETDRKDRDAIEGAKIEHNLSGPEAAFLLGRRKMEADQAKEREHRTQLGAFLRHCNSEIDKQGADPSNVSEWKRCLVEVVCGRWPDSKMLQSDPVVSLRFQQLRAKLNAATVAARPKVTKVENPYFAWK